MSTSTGQLLDQSLRSRALVRDMRLHIYLPPLYGQFELRYPVLYLLHPWGEDEHYWAQALDLAHSADHLIHAGAVPPFVAVMPQGDKSFFLDAADPGGDFTPMMRLDPQYFAGALEGYGDYGSYLIHDVIPFVEKELLVRGSRASRAVAGVEMGATGAAALAFTHPDMFCAVGIHSPLLFSKTRLGPPWIFGLSDDASFAPRSPLHLARHLAPSVPPRIYLDCTQADESAEEVHALHIALDVRKIPHTYQRWDGDGGPAAWQTHLAEYLGFYAAGW